MTNAEYRQHVADGHFQVSIMFDKLADAEKRDNPISERAYSDYRKHAAKHNAIATKWESR